MQKQKNQNNRDVRTNSKPQLSSPLTDDNLPARTARLKNILTQVAFLQRSGQLNERERVETSLRVIIEDVVEQLGIAKEKIDMLVQLEFQNFLIARISHDDAYRVSQEVLTTMLEQTMRSINLLLAQPADTITPEGRVYLTSLKELLTLLKTTSVELPADKLIILPPKVIEHLSYVNMLHLRFELGDVTMSYINEFRKLGEAMMPLC